MATVTCNWWFEGDFQGTTERSPEAANLHVLCDRCGAIWASVQRADGKGHWTCSHRPCTQHGLGSLAGADWTSKPYEPLNLPHALLLRELELAICHPDRYTR